MSARLHTILFLGMFATVASVSAAIGGERIKVVVDSPPLTLDPRMSLDAMSQKVGALLYNALTRLDRELTPVPSIASSWSHSPDLRRWTFTIAPQLVDHDGETITAEKMVRCLEQYRAGVPRSMVGVGFPSWLGSKTVGSNQIEISLGEADPFFPRNASLLRYFRAKGKTEPCSTPQSSEAIVGSGPLRVRNPRFPFPSYVEFDPINSQTHRGLGIYFIRDELPRLFLLLNGEADATLNGLSLSQTRWVEQSRRDQFTVQAWESSNIQYLGFRLSDPILAKQPVREAISLAIDRSTITRQKYFDYLSPAGSFLPPWSPDFEKITLPFDLDRARSLLDSSGFPLGPNGKRFSLRYLTTSVRDGFELAQLVQASLKKIGIEVQIEMVEPGIYFDRLRKGGFQLYSSRWIGVADASILERTLGTRGKTNRVGYKNPALDHELAQAKTATSDHQRSTHFRAVQKIMAQDLPYAPLWAWKAALVIRKDREQEFSKEHRSASSAIDLLARKDFP